MKKGLAVLVVFITLASWLSDHAAAREVEAACNLARNHFLAMSGAGASIFDGRGNQAGSFGRDTTIFYWRGYVDGTTYYRPTGPFIGGTVLGVLAVFTFGATTLGVVLITSTYPKDLSNDQNPNGIWLASNPEYRKGYLSAARRKKTGKTWTGFGMGVASGLAIALVLLVTLQI